jgi:hypothetical protein
MMTDNGGLSGFLAPIDFDGIVNGHEREYDKSCACNNMDIDELLENFDLYMDRSDDDWNALTSVDSVSVQSDDHILECGEESKKRKISNNDMNSLTKRRSADKDAIFSIPQSILDPTEYYLRIPWELYGAVNTAVNVGNSIKLNQLIDELFHEKCVLRWERSIFSMEKVGAKTMKEFFDALLRTVGPDCVITIRNISHRSIKNGLELLKCKLYYSGTILYQHCMEEFQGFKSPHKSSVEYMDASRFSQEEIEKLKQNELAMRKQGLKIEILGKLKVKFFIDSVTRKIVGYEEIFRLSSFNYVDTPSL